MRSRRVGFITLVVVLAFRPSPVSAGLIFTGGWVESRAYSALMPDTDFTTQRHDIVSLPFDLGTSAVEGATSSLATYQLTESSAGAHFRWDVQQARDGGRDSFSVATGELSFQVDEPTSFQLGGGYQYSGSGQKFAYVRLYDSPSDVAPIFAWQQSTMDDVIVFQPEGNGELGIGVGYRLVFRLLLDNPNITTDLATVNAQFDFTIGTPDEPAFPGDTDGNGRVDVVDLNHVRNNFGQQGDGVLGDTHPLDGSVDIADLNAVRNNFGAVRAESVPEPAGAVILLAAGGGLVVARRSRTHLGRVGPIRFRLWEASPTPMQRTTLTRATAFSQKSPTPIGVGDASHSHPFSRK